jgi:hypothetical protein
LLLRNQRFIEDKPNAAAVVIDQRQQTVVTGHQSFENVIKGALDAPLDGTPLLSEAIDADIVDIDA